MTWQNEGVAREQGARRRQKRLGEGLGNEWGDVGRLLGIRGAGVLGRSVSWVYGVVCPTCPGSFHLGPRAPPQAAAPLPVLGQEPERYRCCSYLRPCPWAAPLSGRWC